MTIDVSDYPMATIRIASDTLDPELVTAVIGYEPQCAARKGDLLYPTSTSTRAVARTGTWFATTEGLKVKSPTDHLDRLVELALPHVKMLRETMPDITFDLSLLVFDPDFSANSLPDDLIRKAQRLGTLEIDSSSSEQVVL